MTLCVGQQPVRAERLGRLMNVAIKSRDLLGMTGLSGNELTAPLIPPPALPGRLTSCSPAVTTEIESLSLVTAHLGTWLQTISGARPEGISWTQFEKTLRSFTQEGKTKKSSVCLMQFILYLHIFEQCCEIIIQKQSVVTRYAKV